MGASWALLGASWAKYRKNLECDPSFEAILASKMEAKSIKNRLQKATHSSQRNFNVFCSFFRTLSYQLMVTCAGRILTKHWLGAQKSRFGWDSQAESLSPKVMAKIALQTPKRHENEVKNQAKSGQVRSRHLMTCAGASGKIPPRLVLGSELKRHIRRSLRWRTPPVHVTTWDE